MIQEFNNISNFEIKSLLSLAIEAANEAGVEIMQIYNSEIFDITFKEDQSPLTKADKASHSIIINKLKHTGLPVLSEEGSDIDYETRTKWDFFWLIDPIDGTKEFIKKNGEFTVNIALINKNKPVLGVVFAPALELMYYGCIMYGSFKKMHNQQPQKLLILKPKLVTSIVASKSHLNYETQQFIDNYPEAKVISMGSSLKFMLVAENRAQLYPRFSPTMEWDTAAAQAIIESAGGQVLMYPENYPLQYNKRNLLNPSFIVK